MNFQMILLAKKIINLWMNQFSFHRIIEIEGIRLYHSDNELSNEVKIVADQKSYYSKFNPVTLINELCPEEYKIVK